MQPSRDLVGEGSPARRAYLVVRPSRGAYARPRDSQKSKLYAAERAAEFHVNQSRQARRYLLDEARLLPQRSAPGAVTTKAPSIEDCQRYVDDLVVQPWFQRRWGRVTIPVHWKASGSATGGHGKICLPPWARTEGVILHEAAHHLHPHRARDAAHGPEFVGVLLTLVRYRMGATAAEAFQLALHEHRVRVDLRRVPPAVLPVITATERRITNAALQKAALSTLVAARLAAVIRRLAAQGELGEPGSRLRRRALNVARILHTRTNAAAKDHSEEDLRAAAEHLRRAIRSGTFGPAGRKPREHALRIARAIDAIAEDRSTPR